MRQQIESFLRQLSTEKKFSVNTVAAYRNDLLQMADFFQEKGTHKWSEVSQDLVLGYVTDLRSRGYALTTVARKTASAFSGEGITQISISIVARGYPCAASA